MYPIIVSYKFLTIGTYGIMLGIAFYSAFLLLERELKRVEKDPDLAYSILIMAIVGGIVGAKVFHILDYFDEFLRDPRGMILSGAGLSVLGGYVFAILGSYVIVRKAKEDFLSMADLASPALSLGYAVGRIGCHVSGDGCYGVTTSSVLGVAYPNGIVPVSIPVFPTPLFESLVAFIITGILLHLATSNLPRGFRFSLYLLLSGLARFSVEFIRTNPKVLLGLSQAQVTSLLFLAAGVVGIILSMRKRQTAS